ncbi:hypothetical protein CBM2633_U10037 [Cupriavidus taiwanensis]|nr:hypothetical protein CBM2633_U10037 [Cupriavidus taiwanensis]
MLVWGHSATTAPTTAGRYGYPWYKCYLKGRFSLYLLLLQEIAHARRTVRFPIPDEARGIGYGDGHERINTRAHETFVHVVVWNER